MNNPIEILDTFAEKLNNNETDGLQILTALLELPDEDFEILKPLIIESLIEVYNQPDVQLQVIQELNKAGISINELITQTNQIADTLFENQNLELSDSKKEFLHSLFVTMANTLESSPLNSSRTITIPIMLCRENAKLPKYATDGSAAMDIYSPDEYIINPGDTIIIPTGLKVAIPKGYALLIQPRSGLSRKIKLRIPNSPGLIDSDYHEEIGVICENITSHIQDVSIEFKTNAFETGAEPTSSILYGSSITIGKGERFAQMRLIEVPKVKWNQVTSLGEYFTEDHGKGFGSTGEK